MDYIEALRAPTPPNQIKKRKGPGGKMLDYVTARWVMDRFDETVGPENWQTRFHEVAGKVCCEIGVKINDEWVWKSDGAGETSIEGEKGAFSDALKRAAVQWGPSRDLYPDSEISHKQAALDALPGPGETARDKAVELFRRLSDEDQAEFLKNSKGITVEQLTDDRLGKAMVWMTARL